MSLAKSLNLAFWMSTIFVLTVANSLGQEIIKVDGKSFDKYNQKYFNPHRGLFYTLYAAPVITVDPLGIGGKSTYAVSIGARLNIWESKSGFDKLSGLKIAGFYLGGGFEYYPQQYNKTYISGWLRIKTFMPLVARMDSIYAAGYGLQGFSTRYCFGFEIKSITVLLCGETYTAYVPGLGFHPNTETPYTNAGAVMVIVPFLTRKDR